MMGGMLRNVVLLAAALHRVHAQDPIGGLSGSHTDIPRWCGKPYMAGSPNYDPGGMIHGPVWTQPTLLVQPRYSFYVDTECSAEISVSIVSPTSNKTTLDAASYGWSHSQAWDFELQLVGSPEKLAFGHVSLDAGPASVSIELENIEAKLEPYELLVHASPSGRGGQSYSMSTELYYLPAKTSGSMVKIDNLHGGMLVANNVTNYAFEPLLPFGFYTSCSGYLNYSLANVSAYKDMGFNAINPVCAFTDGNLDYLYDWMDKVNLWYQYDMRGSYLNLSSVARQIPLVKDRSSFLSWYTADEPDGWQYALNSTKLAYDLLKREDPYHPIGLVLNCENYYFKEYTSGADYIMEDAYPVGIDPTYSRPWNTTCNETYGDCGCDDCIGSLTDVSTRLDDFYEYQSWLGQWEKPLWAVLQAFSGEGYWSRDPTPEETWVMMLLSFNHHAKGMMSWTFPASPVLEAAHAAMAKVTSRAPVSSFLLGGQSTTVEVQGYPALDVAYWRDEDKALLSLAVTDTQNIDSTVEIRLPFAVHGVQMQPWGNLTYIANGKNSLSVSGLSGLATSLMVLRV